MHLVITVFTSGPRFLSSTARFPVNSLSEKSEHDQLKTLEHVGKHYICNFYVDINHDVCYL